MTNMWVEVRKQDSDKFKKQHFRDLLDEWCNVVLRYAEYEPRDALYWYNERATLSSFAVAAGRKDFHVLEEYTGEKKRTKKYNGKKKKYKGRFDLYITRDKYEYVFEAKQCWVSISPEENKTKETIEKSIKNAKESAEESYREVGKHNTYAMVFIVPHIAKEFASNKHSLIEGFVNIVNEIARLDQKMEFAGLSYVFPENIEAQTTKLDSYPGVACLLFCLK